MGDISTGDDPDGKNKPDSAIIPGVDAQEATEEDLARGIGGAEAKPFSPAAGGQLDDTAKASSESKTTAAGTPGEKNLISGRRNPGREAPDANNKPVRGG